MTNDCNFSKISYIFVQDVFKIFRPCLFCLEIGPSVETDCKTTFHLSGNWAIGTNRLQNDIPSVLISEKIKKVINILKF